MESMQTYLDRTLYPGYQTNWDDLIFRDRILRYLRPDSTVLDIGAGAGIVAEMNFKDQVASIAGVDPDERVLENPYLTEAHIGTGENLPFEDGSFDVVFADNVMEHLEDPETVLREVNRVLKPGGIFLGKTPNAYHYMPLIARLTPHWFHAWVNRKRGRQEADTFPTRYRANTPRAVRRIASQTGFEPLSIELIEGRPEYLRMMVPTYLIGWAYERLVNHFGPLALFRILLVVVLRKTTAAHGEPGQAEGDRGSR